MSIIAPGMPKIMYMQPGISSSSVSLYSTWLVNMVVWFSNDKFNYTKFNSLLYSIILASVLTCVPQRTRYVPALSSAVEIHVSPLNSTTSGWSQPHAAISFTDVGSQSVSLWLAYRFIVCSIIVYRGRKIAQICFRCCRSRRFGTPVPPIGLINTYLYH